MTKRVAPRIACAMLGLEIRRASLVQDVLIALSARAIGATLLTMDSDYRAIARVIDARWELVTR